MKAAFAAAILAVAASSAFAQSPPPPSGPAPGGPAQVQPNPPPADLDARGPDGRGPDGRGPDGRGPRGDRDGYRGMGERRGMMMHHMRHHPMMSKGARFTFERGESKVEIKCDGDEPMKACADAAILLLDKLGAMHR